MKNVSMTVAFLSAMTTLARSMGKLNFSDKEVEDVVQKGIERKFLKRTDTFTGLEIDFMKNGQKIQAIKEVRNRTGLGLYDAKVLVDEKMAKEGWVAKNY